MWTKNIWTKNMWEKNMNVAIIDTGCANLASVKYAFDRMGASAEITDRPETILSAPRVILPGVGAAPYAIKYINNNGLSKVVKSIRQPLLGICLGMQLLYENLEEGGKTINGLGLVKGCVKRLNTLGHPSPHMGWNQLTVAKNHPLLSGINNGDYAYFVHAYAAELSRDTLAQSEYGSAFTAIIGKNNVYGCQFHPERSSAVGARILSNFLELSP